MLCQVCDRYNTQQGGTAPFFERDLLVRPHSTEHLMVPNRSGTSSPETWSYTDSVPARPQSAVTASAAATQAALRRLLGFDDDESQDIMRKVCCYVSHGSISICRHYTNDTHLKRHPLWSAWAAASVRGLHAVGLVFLQYKFTELLQGFSLGWSACCIVFWDISTS